MAKLYFYYASMNAGKSTNLLQADFNYRERGMATMLFTAAVDDRFAAGTIASRIGLSAPATMFDPATDIAACALRRHAETPLACVLVDEAQFLTAAQVDQLAALTDRAGYRCSLTGCAPISAARCSKARRGCWRWRTRWSRSSRYANAGARRR